MLIFFSWSSIERQTKEVATACSKFFNNIGKDVAYFFDGYDEFPDDQQKDSLVADILKRWALPQCGLMVSSCPHASVKLWQQATIRVEILGLTEEKRKLYIKQNLKGHQHVCSYMYAVKRSLNLLKTIC